MGERESFAEQRVRAAFDSFEATLMKLLSDHGTTADLREIARVTELLTEARAWALDAVQ
jgi:hypothetical protein